MNQWLDLLALASLAGEPREDRTGVGTRSLFGETVSFDLADGFPAVTTKKLAFKQVAAELACFVRGYDNLAQFHDMGCTIWDANGTADYWKPRTAGDLGRIYGAVWRNMNGVDQLKELINGLRAEPNSRRHVVTAWSPGEAVCLPPCHTHFQCSVRSNKRLDVVVYMRSVDLFLGFPFDIASYALLAHLLARDTGTAPGILRFFLGDAHIYNNHKEAVATVLKRQPKKLPVLLLDTAATTLEFLPTQANLLEYSHWSAVKAEMAV